MQMSVMNFSAQPSVGRPNEMVSRRFGWVLAGERSGPDSVFDHDLLGAACAALTPTKGAIVPEWLLVVPRLPALSVAQLPASFRKDVFEIATAASDRIKGVAGGSVIFEHGAGHLGSASGCGVDQAHLHVVGLGRSFVDSVLRDHSAGLEWMQANVSDPWAGLPYDADYLLIVDEDRAWVALPPSPVSQFMRRRIANFVGSPGEWDYRRYPHAENARRTKSAFGAIQDGWRRSA